MVLDPAFSTGRLPRSGILSLPPSDACLSNTIRSKSHQASACLCPHCIMCIRGMHNLHFRGIPACTICISWMHNMHQTRAQYAYGAVRTAAPRTARRAAGLALLLDKQRQTRAQQLRNDRGPPSGGPLPHTVGPGGPTVPRKARPAGGALVGSPFSRSAAYPDS